MANKTDMPDRIWAWDQDGFRDFDNMASWKENGIVSDFEGAEYIRADLVQSDANEPLADGQMRWVRLSKDESFIPATIHKDALRKGRLIYFICGNEMEDYVEDCYELGPVIRPPEDI